MNGHVGTDHAERRTVVVVSHTAPPARNAGAIRIEAFVRYLPEFGWDPVVVTSEFTGGGGVAAAETVRVGEPLLTFRRRIARRPDGGDAARPPGPFKTLVLERLAIPDVHVGWVPAAAARVARLARARRAALLFSSSPAESSHLATLVASALTGLPWVVELRDGWAVGGIRGLEGHPLRRRVETWLERVVAARASHLVGVSRTITRDLEQRFGEATWISNGFDETVLSSAAFEAARRLMWPDCFNLVYTGKFGRSRRAISPRVLSEALSELSRTPDAPQVSLTVVGRLDPHERELLASSPRTRLVPEQPHAVVLALQSLADALVLVTAPGEASVPGKLFEYLAAGRPMLALADGSEAGDLVTELGGGIVVPANDTAAVVQGIGRLAAGAVPGRAPGPTLSQFTRRSLTQRLAGVFDDVVAAG